MTIEDGALVLRRSSSPARAGWAGAAGKVAEAGDGELVMGEFGNAQDSEAPFRIGINHGGRKGLILVDQVRAADKTRLAMKLGAVSARTLTATLRTLQEVFAE